MDLEATVGEHAAVCCMELQRGIVGDLSTVPATRAAVVEANLLARVADLLATARSVGVPVVHCTASFRPDGIGSYVNMPMIERLRANPGHLEVGSASVEVVPELWDRDTDLLVERHHGISPFGGTALDTLLRTMGVTTIVAVGVSLNRGITGLTIEAVNLGYRVVIPRDGVVGYPAEYGRAVLEHTLAGIATITTGAELHDVWARSPASPAPAAPQRPSNA
jgi:nicotinamidase-related amidase